MAGHAAFGSEPSIGLCRGCVGLYRVILGLHRVIWSPQ